MPVRPSNSPAEESAFRDSAVMAFPPNLAISDVERDRWQSFNDEVTGDDAFWQLVVILGGCIATSVRWTEGVLSRIASPESPQREERLAALITIRTIAKLPPSEPVQGLQLSGTQLQSILGSILPPDDDLLQLTGLDSQPGLESTAIRIIAKSLQTLGIPLDLEVLLARRRQILGLLPHHHHIRVGPFRQVLTITSLQKYRRVHREIEDHLERPPHTENSDIVELGKEIIALSRCEEFTWFLQTWSESLEAERLISEIDAALDRESAYSNRLVILLTGSVIQHSFYGPGEKRGSSPGLPSCLCPEGPSMYQNAASSYARKYRLQSLLSVLQPSLSFSHAMTPDTDRAFDAFWDERFPSHWSEGMNTSATLRSESPNQELSRDDKSYLSADTSPDGRWSFFSLFTRCFST